MNSLYVEKIPDELYEAIKQRARERRSSIAAEVIAALAQHFPAQAELRRRQAAFRRALKLQRAAPLGPGPFPSAEAMVREERER